MALISRFGMTQARAELECTTSEVEALSTKLLIDQLEIYRIQRTHSDKAVAGSGNCVGQTPYDSRSLASSSSSTGRVAGRKAARIKLTNNITVSRNNP